MYYVGLDVHRDWTTISALDVETGDMVRLDRVPNNLEDFSEALTKLQGPLHGLMETGPNSWALYNRWCPLFETLVVCDARELKQRMPARRAKTDRLDADQLALMLAEGRTPDPLVIPSLETRDLRALTRGRIKLTQVMTILINYSRSLGASFGHQASKKSLHCADVKAWFAGLDLPPLARQVLDRFLAALACLEDCTAELQKLVEEQAEEDPGARHLMTMPGVRAFSALCLRAELGDATRFDDEDAVVAYAGLAPQVHQSGERCRYGPLPHTGDPWLRYVAVLIAQHVGRAGTNRLARYRFRTMMRRGANPAKIATARKVVALAYHLLLHQEDFYEPPREAA